MGRFERRFQPAAAWLCAVLVLLGTTTAAHGQGDGTRDLPSSDSLAGDGGSYTSEIDSCRKPRGIANQDVELNADEHYGRGVKLYLQGDYEAAIEEFVLAYCLFPAPTVAKDIAQSFERLVQYEKAVAYLEIYIRGEQDQEKRQAQSARVEVLRNLPARVRIATDPPRATVTLTSTSGVRRSGVTNSKEPLKLPHGRYTMVLTMAGHDPVQETIDVQIGQPYSFYYRLTPKKGTLRVVAVPANARIFVNKRRVALGTYVDQLPIGRYQIEVEADGRTARTEEVEIIAEGHKNLPIELAKKPRSGRAELLGAAGVGGLAWGGTLGAIFSEDTLLSTVGGFVGLGVGFGSAYLGIPDDIPVGHSSYMIGSSMIGLAEGLLISSFFSCSSSQREDDGQFERVGCDSALITGTTLAGGTAGLLFGALTAESFNLDAGDAAIINSSALWGSISGALLWLVFDNDVRLDEPLIFGGLNAGLLTGALLSSRYDVSRGHLALIDLSGLLGVVVGASFVDLADQDEGFSERVPHFALLGMGVGLLTGAYLTRHMDEPKSLGSLSPSLGAARDASGNSSLTFGLQGQF